MVPACALTLLIWSLQGKSIRTRLPSNVARRCTGNGWRHNMVCRQRGFPTCITARRPYVRTSATCYRCGDNRTKVKTFVTSAWYHVLVARWPYVWFADLLVGGEPLGYCYPLRLPCCLQCRMGSICCLLSKHAGVFLCFHNLQKFIQNRPTSNLVHQCCSLMTAIRRTRVQFRIWYQDHVWLDRDTRWAI